MDQHSLERLGHHIVSRRVALGYRTRTDIANSLQFTVRTLSDIENGVRKASPGTYAMLENKLAWAPGSIDTILTDEEPTETVVELRRTNADTASQRYALRPTNAQARRCPARTCCWSYGGASQPAAIHATKPGTTGTTASTPTAIGPKRVSRAGVLYARHCPAP
jgi:hypothetical protein